MRTAIEQRKDLAIDIENDDRPAADIDDLAVARRQILERKDDMFAHVNPITAKPPEKTKRRQPNPVTVRTSCLR